MNPKKSENEPLKKTEKENRRLGKPITRAFLKANRGLMAELKRSLETRERGGISDEILKED